LTAREGIFGCTGREYLAALEPQNSHAPHPQNTSLKNPEICGSEESGQTADLRHLEGVEMPPVIKNLEKRI